MRLSPIPLAYLLSAASTAACANEPPDQYVMLGGCRQGECGWLRVVAVEPAGSFPQGHLQRIRLQRGTSLHPAGDIPQDPERAGVRWEDSERTEYAFCSTARPAYAFPSGDGLIVHFLDPFDPGGYQMGSARLYMHFCHGRGLAEADELRLLGYRPGTRNEQVENSSVETLTRF